MREGKILTTPNGQAVTALRVIRRGTLLLVETRSRIYYARRGKLILWKRR